ncbi:OTU domain-containing protein 3 [Hyalella azteca]|uniref:OTU domain-containing protein 3 n=1 Tax=Hyalella azteca TaxID=294128 RepID=A0A8B7P1Y1_HYAAZ|nr:OTU domain-containing protein 3 [Hyalella azteca]XP_047738879.1 OTU domain-containing protein 3 [Hyalella azteca]
MARKREESASTKHGPQQQAGSGATGNSKHSGSSSSGSSSGSGKGSSGSNNAVPVYASLKQQLAMLGLAMREIPGDGNCLFGALADQVDGSRATHFKHRKEIVAYMQNNRMHFEPFVEDDVSFHDHLRRLSEAGTFGGNECIVAFARLHNVMVVIHQLNTALWTICGSEDSESDPNLYEVHISYHNGDHYNSVRRMGDCSNSPANIRTALLVMNGGNKQLEQDRAERRELEIRLMHCTNCKDEELVRHFLEEHNYNFDEAIEALLVHIHEKPRELHGGEMGRRRGEVTALWREDGSGSRVLGQEAAALALAESTSTMEAPKDGWRGSGSTAEKLQAKLKQPHISNTKRQELKKQLKKQQQRDRKRHSEAEDASLDSDYGMSDDCHTIVVPDIACLRI